MLRCCPFDSSTQTSFPNETRPNPKTSLWYLHSTPRKTSSRTSARPSTKRYPEPALDQRQTSSRPKAAHFAAAVERPLYSAFVRPRPNDPVPRQPPPKNKLQTPVPFSDHDKVSVKTPRSPHTPPQIHHNLPSRNTPKTEKSPIKPTLHHKPLFPCKSARKIASQEERRPSESCIGNCDARTETKTTME
jgi:hypothetical protein